MKPYYSEYVRHCLRYYIKTWDEAPGCLPAFKSDADKANWSACYYVLRDYSQSNFDTVAEIYRPGDTISDKIYQMAKDRGVHQDTIWSLVNTTERKIAKKRGLL